MKCPVCKNECKSNVNECTVCGFTELEAEFLNEEEVLEWQNKIVIPYRATWKKKSEVELRNSSYDNQLNRYFGYTKLSEYVEQHINDDSKRSQLIDYLHQIWMYRYNYPVDDRQRLFDELISHISYFEERYSETNDLRYKFTSLDYLEKKAEMYLSEGWFDKTVECYYDFLSDNWFEKELRYLKNGGEPIFAVYTDLYYLILHNCSIICKMVSLEPLSDMFKALLNRIDEIRYENYDRSYDYLYFQGMQINIQSPDNDNSTNAHLAKKGNVRSGGSTYDICLYGTLEKPLFSSTFGDVPWIGQQCNVEEAWDGWQIVGVNDNISSDISAEVQLSITKTCRKIISLFI